MVYHGDEPTPSNLYEAKTRGLLSAVFSFWHSSAALVETQNGRSLRCFLLGYRALRVELCANGVSSPVSTTRSGWAYDFGGA
jgi:hypothetical protein